MYWMVCMDSFLCFKQSRPAFYTFNMLLWQLMLTIHQTLSPFPWAHINTTFTQFPCWFMQLCDGVLDSGKRTGQVRSATSNTAS